MPFGQRTCRSRALPDGRARGHARWADKDGFRLLLDVGADGEVPEWSRHGTDLTHRLGSVVTPFNDVAPGTTFDGELVAVSERDGKPAQDFTTVTRAVFTGNAAASQRLRFVAFDLLVAAGQDVRPCAWEERDAQLRETLPVCARVRLIESQPATLAAHQAIVGLGFEGTVLKRIGSAYRPGRHRTWIKQKARFTARAELCSVHQDRAGHWHALCELDGRRVHAVAGPGTAERIGQLVELVYSRVDADGTLREARVARATMTE